MNIEIFTHPSKKEDVETNNKIKKIIEDRSAVIAKDLKTDVRDINVNMYFDGTSVASKVGRTTDDKLGIFSGYIDYENCFHIAHPIGIEPIFGDNLWKQMGIMIDYCLYKFYLCQIYFPKGQPYKLYFKYLTDSLARLLSGYYNRQSLLFEVRNYSDFKKYKKDTELKIAFFTMLEKSESTMVTDNLDELYETCDIKKSLITVYKKDFKELIGLYQKELIEADKEIKKVR